MDTTSWRTMYPWPSFLGKASGESFFAEDTLIKSISVWRFFVGGGADYGVPMKLWIVRTDSTGYPQPYDVVLEGPILRVPADSGATRPIKVQYVFDPPVVLPARGGYAFFVQDPCLLLSSVLVDTTRNVYPEGKFWDTGRDVGPACHLDYASAPYPRADMIFEIEFCHESTTPVRRETWGHLKQLYR